MIGQNWIGAKILKFIGNKFDGQKSRIGGGGLILWGVMDLLTVAMPSIVADYGIPAGTVESGITKITGGFSILGIAGKIAKIPRK